MRADLDGKNKATQLFVLPAAARWRECQSACTTTGALDVLPVDSCRKLRHPNICEHSCEPAVSPHAAHVYCKSSVPITSARTDKVRRQLMQGIAQDIGSNGSGDQERLPFALNEAIAETLKRQRAGRSAIQVALDLLQACGVLGQGPAVKSASKGRLAYFARSNGMPSSDAVAAGSTARLTKKREDELHRGSRGDSSANAGPRRPS